MIFVNLHAFTRAMKMTFLFYSKEPISLESSNITCDSMKHGLIEKLFSDFELLAGLALVHLFKKNFDHNELRVSNFITTNL